MTRYTFGGYGGDQVAQDPTLNAGIYKSAASIAATGTFWSAQTLGTQYTDLIDPVTTVALAGVSTDTRGRVAAFMGPNGITEGWLDFGAGRFKVTAVDSNLGDARYAKSATLLSQGGALASLNGVVGDGVTDDGVAMNAFLTSCASLGVPAILNPLSTVLTSIQITPPSNSRIKGNGATLKAKSTLAAGDRLIYLSGKTNVTIEDLIVNGDKASFAGVTEQRHGIMITAACSNITIRNVTSKLNKGDGVYVGGGSSSAASVDIMLDNVTCDSNHRNGLSITAVSHFEANGCRFINSSGTAPQNGVDIEVDLDTDIIEAVAFVDCVFSGNVSDGCQVLVHPTATVRQGDVTFLGCSSLDNGRHGFQLYDVAGVKVVGGQSSGNTQHGFEMVGTVSNEDVALNAVTISNNQRSGIHAGMAFNDLKLIALNVKNNGSATPGFYPGIDLAPTAASTNVHMYGCKSTGSNQPYGYRDNSNCSKVHIISNRLSGSTSAFSLGNDVTTRVIIDENGTCTFPAQNIFRAASTSVLNIYRVGDSAPRISLTTDSRVQFGSGTANDLGVFRASAGVLGIDGPATTGTTAPGAGGAGALPATPAGYLTVNINGTNRQIPYY